MKCTLKVYCGRRPTMGLPRTNLLGCILAVAASQPNFVYILMDDTDELLGSASLMTRTKALVGDRGATFSRFRTLSPKCTPSRTGQLTGRHYHNVRPGARGPGLDEATLFDADALFPALRRAGVLAGVPRPRRCSRDETTTKAW